MLAQQDTLTIAITEDIIESQRQICDFISRLLSIQCKEVNIKLLLLSTVRHEQLKSKFTDPVNNLLNFNQIVIANEKSLASIAQAMEADIVLTTNHLLVDAFKACNLATVLVDKAIIKNLTEKQTLHFAFDGDSVLFCHNAQLVADNNSIAAFETHEEKHANKVMGKGPLYNFIRKIDTLQKHNQKVRWSLVTARGGKAFKRAMHTIEQWKLTPDQCFFMEGSDKTPILKVIESDMFFDDHPKHCQRASGHMLVGHVQVSY